MHDSLVIGRHKHDVDTPALLLDMDVVERNVEKMAAFFAGKECKLRPHMKTHKLPLIGHMQMQVGAIGVTCAKLDEAEVFLKSGIGSVLIANQVVSPPKIRKMVNLSRYGELIVCVDDFDNARVISETAGEAGVGMNVLVEVNVGIDRCGVLPGEFALELVRRLSDLPNIVFRGVMGYEGGVFVKDQAEREAICRHSNALLVDTKELLERNGFPVEIVSAGGSNSYHLTGIYPGITEVQVGSYVTMDAKNREYGIDFDQALTVLATVISRQEKGRAVIDVGMKSVSSDAGMPEVCGDGLSIFQLNEEHGHLRIHNPDCELKPGDKIELIPRHGCTTIPLYDNYIITRGDRVESVAQIPARHAK